MRCFAVLFERFYGPQLDVAPFPLGFKLNSGIRIVPLIADYSGVVFTHGLLHCLNGFAVILLGEGLTLEHQVLRFRQSDDVKPFGDNAIIRRLLLFSP